MYTISDARSEAIKLAKSLGVLISLVPKYDDPLANDPTGYYMYFHEGDETRLADEYPSVESMVMFLKQLNDLVP